MARMTKKSPAEIKKLYSPFPKTRKQQIENERRLLTRIKQVNRQGKPWTTLFVFNVSTYNALDRLEAKALVRFAKRRKDWSSGYVAKGFGFTRRGIEKVA